MKNDEHMDNGTDKNRQHEDNGHGGREHHPEPKPEPPGRVIHPRPSHGDSGTR